MKAVLKHLRELLEGVKELLKLLVEIWLIAKRFPLLLAVIVVAAGIYFGARWYVFDYPQRCIYRFYSSLGAHDFGSAWECLADDYRRSRWPNQEQFAAGYRTIAYPSDRDVTFPGSKINPFGHVLSSTMQYAVQYGQEERFTREHLEDPQQRENALWLQIVHPNGYRRLLDGTLDGENPSVTLNRYFKETVTVKRTSRGWAIAGVRRTERGVR